MILPTIEWHACVDADLANVGAVLHEPPRARARRLRRERDIAQAIQRAAVRSAEIRLVDALCGLPTKLMPICVRFFRVEPVHDVRAVRELGAQEREPRPPVWWVTLVGKDALDLHDLHVRLKPEHREAPFAPEAIGDVVERVARYASTWARLGA